MTRDLFNLYEGTESDRDFAVQYAGSYQPARLPHRADWQTANGHWLRALGRFYSSSNFIRYANRPDAADIAVQHVKSRLWPRAIRGLCYACTETGEGLGEVG